MARILFFVTEDWYFCSHRLPLAIAAKKAGHEVVVLTRVVNHGEEIRSHGLLLEPLNFSRRDGNPIKELILLMRLAGIYRRLSPDLAHHVALKPVIYGACAAWLSGLSKTVSAIAGLGYVFSSNQPRARMLRPWIRLACRILLNHDGSRVIVQNPDDRHVLISQGIVKEDRIELIRGAGVDVTEFSPQREPSGVPLVVLPARLLWEKGVAEFVAAAKILRDGGHGVRFALVGEPDTDNPRAVPRRQIEEWQKDGVIEWWGRRSDMPDVYAQCSVVCLPTSYGEGIPKALLEAAACGRPIVATDAPGCREVVRDGENGFLVPLRDAEAVAKAIGRLLRDPDLRRRMGEKGRELAVREFSVEQVVNQTLVLYNEILAI